MGGGGDTFFVGFEEVDVALAFFLFLAHLGDSLSSPVPAGSTEDLGWSLGVILVRFGYPLTLQILLLNLHHLSCLRSSNPI